MQSSRNFTIRRVHQKCNDWISIDYSVFLNNQFFFYFIKKILMWKTLYEPKGYLPVMTKRRTIEVLVGFDLSWHFPIYSVMIILYLSSIYGIWNCTICDGLDIYKSQLYHVKMLKQVVNFFTDRNRKSSIKQECDSKWIVLESDTLSKDDSVRKQYLSLPYPAVPEHALRAEYNHYKGRKKKNTSSTLSTSLGDWFGKT